MQTISYDSKYVETSLYYLPHRTHCNNYDILTPESCY